MHERAILLAHFDALICVDFVRNFLTILYRPALYLGDRRRQNTNAVILFVCS